MKLTTYIRRDAVPGIGLLVEGGIVDLATVMPRLAQDMIQLIRGGGELLDTIRHVPVPDDLLDLAAARLLAPIPRPPEYLGVGLNYHGHAQEAGLPTPSVPIIFNKQTSCVVGPFDAAAIFGYVVVSDFSVRDWQFSSPTATLGKSSDTHGPFGPWIVTRDEIADDRKLVLTTRVNGEVRQHGTTADMIFACSEIVAFLLRVMTLQPGTVIATGTPAGVGHSRRPPAYLRAGDMVAVDIPGLGGLVNRVIAEAQ